MTYNRNINQWQYVGLPGFSDNSASNPHLIIVSDGTIYISFVDREHDNKISVMTYSKNINQWQYVGKQGFVSQVEEDSFTIAPDGTLYIAFRDLGNKDQASVMTYNKNNNQWQYVGRPGCSNSEAWSNTLSIAPNGVLHLAFHNGIARGKSTVMSFY